jgi:hypothetical protein
MFLFCCNLYGRDRYGCCNHYLYSKSPLYKRRLPPNLCTLHGIRVLPVIPAIQIGAASSSLCLAEILIQACGRRRPPQSRHWRSGSFIFTKAFLTIRPPTERDVVLINYCPLPIVTSYSCGSSLSEEEQFH